MRQKAVLTSLHFIGIIKRKFKRKDDRSTRCGPVNSQDALVVPPAPALPNGTAVAAATGGTRDGAIATPTTAVKAGVGTKTSTAAERRFGARSAGLGRDAARSTISLFDAAPKSPVGAQEMAQAGVMSSGAARPPRTTYSALQLTHMNSHGNDVQTPLDTHVPTATSSETDGLPMHTSSAHEMLPGRRPSYRNGHNYMAAPIPSRPSRPSCVRQRSTQCRRPSRVRRKVTSDSHEQGDIDSNDRDNSDAKRDSNDANNGLFRKKGLLSLHTRMRLVMTLLPLLQDTLSLFDDLCEVAVECTHRATEFQQIVAAAMADCVPSVQLSFGLMMVAILKLELVMTVLLALAVFTVWVRPPSVFRKPRRLHCLPLISARMCHVFQATVYGGTVALSVLAFHGGRLSVVVWLLILTGLTSAHHIGPLWTLKLTCMATLSLRVQAPRTWQRVLSRFSDELKEVPGTDFYRESQSPTK